LSDILNEKLIKTKIKATLYKTFLLPKGVFLLGEVCMSTSEFLACRIAVWNGLHDAAGILPTSDLNNLGTAGAESVLRQSRSFSDLVIKQLRLFYLVYLQCSVQSEMHA